VWFELFEIEMYVVGYGLKVFVVGGCQGDGIII